MPIQYDSNGIITQNLSEILDERENALKLIMGEDFVIDKTTPIGNMELADANNELTIQELIAWLIPNMLNAQTATGYFLDCICEKNRIYRKEPKQTTLNLIIHGDAGINFSAEDISVSEEGTLTYYNLNEDVTVGDSGTVVAKFICNDYGEYAPTSTSKFIIQTPLNGLKDVTIDYENANIVVGRLVETDEELRRRREYSVQQTSTSTLASIKANLYSLDGVLHATYFENDTEKTNELGIPMKSFEFVVDGGDENDITDIIFTNKTAGTRAYGETSIKKIDSEGNIYSIGFTKAEPINIGMDIKIKTNATQSNSWKQAVINALKLKFEEIQEIGTSVKDYNYYTVLTTFPEITDITELKFCNTDLEFPTYYSQYVIDKKQIAKLSISDIHITIG